MQSLAKFVIMSLLILSVISASSLAGISYTELQDNDTVSSSKRFINGFSTGQFTFHEFSGQTKEKDFEGSDIIYPREIYGRSLSERRQTLSGNSGMVDYDYQGSVIFNGFDDDILVNDDTTGHVNYQSYPAIARQPSGKTVVVWLDDRSTNRYIYARLFDTNGSPMGDYFRVNDEIEGVGSPAVAINESGRFVVVWRDFRDGITGGNIYCQIFDSNGDKVGNNIKIQNMTSSSRLDPDVAIDNYGNFVVTWSEYDIFCQKFDSLGFAVVSGFMVNDSTESRQAWPAIAMDNSGGFIITWEDELHGFSDYDVYAQRFDSNCTPIGTNFEVNENDSTAIQWSPNIAVDPYGNSVIIWYDATSANPGLYAKLFDSLGQAVGYSFKVNDDTIGIGSFISAPPDVTIDYSGNFIVTWPTSFPWPIASGIVAQRFDISGIHIGSNFRVSSESGHYCNDYMSLACDSIGNFAVCWAYCGQLDRDIVIRFFDSTGNPLDEVMLVADDAGCSDQMHPSITSAKDSSFYIIWDDERDGGLDCYFQQVDNQGNILNTNNKVATVSNRSFPTILTGSDGDILVIWPRSHYLYAQWYNNVGDSIGARFQVNDSITSSTYDWWCPAAVNNRQNNYLIVWKDYRDNPTSRIYAQLYDNHSVPIGANFLVSESGSYRDAGFPVVTTDANNYFIIAWEEGADIYLRRYDSLCNPVGPIEQLNDVSAYHPSLSAGESGNAIVTWSEYTENEGFDIFAQVIEDIDKPARSKFRVNDDNSNEYQGQPDIAVSASGEYIIVWADNRAGGTSYLNYDIFAQKIGSTGNPYGNNFLVNDSTYACYSQCWPDVAVFGDKALVTWQDNRREKGWDIYAKIIDFNRSAEATIVPDTIFKIYSQAIEPMMATIYVGNFDRDYTANDVNTTSIMINEGISPTDVIVVSSHPDFEGMVLNVTVSMKDFLGWYEDIPDTIVNPYSVLGEFTSGESFTGFGDFVLIGRIPVDLNADGKIDIQDVVFLLNYLYYDGFSPEPLEIADLNHDGDVNIFDITYLLGYLYLNGSEH